MRNSEKGESETQFKIISNLSEQHERLINRVIGIAIEVHRHLGPGFLESIYEQAFCYELQLQEIPFEEQVEIQVPYKEISIPGQRLDLIIDRFLIIELKAVEEISSVHEAQLLSYLKSTGLKVGLIINFKVKRLKSGIRRMVL